MSKVERVLGDGAVGDPEHPETTDASTIQPALIDSPEKPGNTLEEQAAADLKAQQKAEKESNA